MTPYERKHPECLKAERKLRIAKGSARSVEEVNRLLKQFEQTKTMMKQLNNNSHRESKKDKFKILNVNLNTPWKLSVPITSIVGFLPCVETLMLS